MLKGATAAPFFLHQVTKKDGIFVIATILMADYYEILELNRTADSTHIRAAYKRLAMQYHPDRNPGNTHAEEKFKQINEAYHVLSDPLKKSRYDARINSFETSTINQEAIWREMQRRRYAQWQQAQQSRYNFDKNYFKIQGLAFLVFIILSGICFGIIHAATYYIEQKRYAAWLETRKLVMEVNTLFDSGKIEDAIARITSLHEKEPLEFQYSTARDSLVDVVRAMSTHEFSTGKYQDALQHLETLKKYEFPPRSETLKKISICQFQLGMYESSLQSAKQLLDKQPWNIELTYQIAMINLRFMNNDEEALHYLNAGKKIFKENLTEIYGEAFQVVMNPEEVPDIYYSIFLERGVINSKLNNYKEAIKDFNWAIFLRPHQAEPYKLRAIAKVKANQRLLVCEDLQMAKKLGAEGADGLSRKYCR